jgi:hypothetical protein
VIEEPSIVQEQIISQPIVPAAEPVVVTIKKPEEEKVVVHIQTLLLLK